MSIGSMSISAEKSLRNFRSLVHPWHLQSRGGWNTQESNVGTVTARRTAEPWFGGVVQPSHWPLPEFILRSSPFRSPTLYFVCGDRVAVSPRVCYTMPRCFVGMVRWSRA